MQLFCLVPSAELSTTHSQTHSQPIMHDTQQPHHLQVQAVDVSLLVHGSVRVCSVPFSRRSARYHMVAGLHCLVFSFPRILVLIRLSPLSCPFPRQAPVTPAGSRTARKEFVSPMPVQRSPRRARKGVEEAPKSPSRTTRAKAGAGAEDKTPVKGQGESKSSPAGKRRHAEEPATVELKDSSSTSVEIITPEAKRPRMDSQQQRHSQRVWLCAHAPLSSPLFSAGETCFLDVEQSAARMSMYCAQRFHDAAHPLNRHTGLSSSCTRA